MYLDAGLSFISALLLPHPATVVFGITQKMCLSSVGLLLSPQRRYRLSYAFTTINKYTNIYIFNLIQSNNTQKIIQLQLKNIRVILIYYFPLIKQQNIEEMGCQNSNLAEIIPVDGKQLHGEEPQPQPQHQPQPQNHSHPQETPHQNGKKKEVDKENRIPSQLSIKLNKDVEQNPLPSNGGDVTKRKAKSENRISEDQLMNDTTNIQPHKEQKKKSVIISQKSKTLSAKGNKEKTVANKIETQVIGPSTHSIPPPQEKQHQEQVQHQMSLPIMLHKQTHQCQGVKQELHPIESLSQELTSQRLSKSFRFQVFIQSQNELLSKTQRLNQQLDHFIQKDQVAKYLNMIEYGEKQEILGKIYSELQKKEEWNESQPSGRQPVVVVMTEHGETVEH